MSSPERWIVGIDGGGSHTTAAVAIVTGAGWSERGRGTAGPSNWVVAGAPESLRQLDLAIARAFANAGVARQTAAAIVVGLAGADRPSARESIAAWLAGVDFTPNELASTERHAEGTSESKSTPDASCAPNAPTASPVAHDSRSNAGGPAASSDAAASVNSLPVAERFAVLADAALLLHLGSEHEQLGSTRLPTIAAIAGTGSIVLGSGHRSVSTSASTNNVIASPPASRFMPTSPQPELVNDLSRPQGLETGPSRDGNPRDSPKLDPTYDPTASTTPPTADGTLSRPRDSRTLSDLSLANQPHSINAFANRPFVSDNQETPDSLLEQYPPTPHEPQRPETPTLTIATPTTELGQPAIEGSTRHPPSYSRDAGASNRPKPENIQPTPEPPAQDASPETNSKISRNDPAAPPACVETTENVGLPTVHQLLPRPDVAQGARFAVSTPSNTASARPAVVDQPPNEGPHVPAGKREYELALVREDEDGGEMSFGGAKKNYEERKPEDVTTWVAGAGIRAGGHGPILGDEGSAYWLVIEGLRALLAMADGIGPSTQDRVDSEASGPTLGTPLGCVERWATHLCESWRIGSLKEIAARVSRLPRAEIAEAAGHVIAGWADGEPMATDVVCRGIAHLADQIGAVARRMGVAREPWQLVLGGGLLVHHPELAEALLQAVRARGWTPTHLQVARDPVHGALAAARRALEISIDWVEETMTPTTAGTEDEMR